MKELDKSIFDVYTIFLSQCKIIWHIFSGKLHNFFKNTSSFFKKSIYFFKKNLFMFLPLFALLKFK